MIVGAKSEERIVEEFGKYEPESEGAGGTECSRYANVVFRQNSNNLILIYIESHMKIKDYYQERDEIISLLQEGIESFPESGYDMGARMRVGILCKKMVSNNKLYVNTIDKAVSLKERILLDIEKLKDESLSNKRPYILDFADVTSEIYRVFRPEDKGESNILNTEDFYSANITELKKREEKLLKEVVELKKKNKKYIEKENEIEEIKIQIQQSVEEKEELKKKLDAQENVKKSISNAFVELKKHITPLKHEKKRLNWMFYSYAFLCISVLCVLVFFEYSYLSKWEGADKWIDYVQYYIPVPIVGGLLWAFIYQMNRAQRQLMQLANVLYRIDYVEGLLLAINSVNADVNAASEKIDHVLDQIIKNYMAIPDSLSDKNLDTEISKDGINIHTFIDMAKEIKEVIK